MRLIERMILLSSIFRSEKGLSKEVQKMKEEGCSKIQEGFKAEEATVKFLENFKKMKEYLVLLMRCMRK